MACNAFEYCTPCLKHLGKVGSSSQVFICTPDMVSHHTLRVFWRCFQVMILVVLFFVVLTAAALLDAYGPDLRGASRGHAAASLLGLVVFFALVGLPHACLSPADASLRMLIAVLAGP